MAEPAELPAEGQGSEPEGPDLEGLLVRAGFNFHVFLAGALAFAAARGAGPDQFIEWVAERLAPTWSGLRGHGADAVLRLVLENLASTGYEVQDVRYGADASQAIVRAVPLGLDGEQWRQLLKPFGLTPDDLHVLFRVFIPLARAAGATLDLAGVRDTLRITVHREPIGGDDESDHGR